MYTLGIDVHKHTSTLVLIDDSSTSLLQETIRSRPDDFSRLLKKLPVPADAIQVALEPVGPWRWIHTLLEAQGMNVVVSNPRKTRLIAESTQKTDMNDATTLAELLRAGYLPTARKVSNEIYQLRLLLRERQHVVRMRVATINRLHGIATTQGLYTITGSNPRTKAGKASIMDGDNTILKELHLLIEEFEKRIAVFDETCAQHVKKLPVAQLLMTIPSVGFITALTVLAEVGDFSDFDNSKKLAAYAGLVPKQRSSGKKISYGAITHAGSPYLRTALVECAMRIHEKGAPELFVMIQRLKPKVGAKKARVALARKLLTLMWHMVTNNQPYDKQRVSLARGSNSTVSDPDTEAGT